MTMSASEIPQEKTDRMVEVLKGIANPIRLRVVMFLCEREHTVGEMADLLGVRQSMVSQHLAPLRMLGLVSVDRRGGRGTYSLQEPLLKNLVQCLNGCPNRAPTAVGDEGESGSNGASAGESR